MRGLHLSADDQETRDAWTLGVIGLLNAYHRKPVVVAEVRLAC
jgi:hypothetical protein